MTITGDTFVQFWNAISAPLITLIVLTLLSFLAGILDAFKAGQFEWNRVADFMRTTVVPKIGGWLLLEVFHFFITPSTVPGESTLMYTMLAGFSTFAYGTAFIAILAKLLSSLYSLGVIPEGITSKYKAAMGKINVAR